VSEGTRRSYATVWPRWCTFLHTLFEVAADPDTPEEAYIPRKLSTHDLARLVGWFAAYMLTELQLKPARIQHEMAALRFQFITRRADIAAFQAEHIKAIRRGLTQTEPEGPQVLHRRLPVTLEMVLHIYHDYSHRSTPYRRASAAAMIMSFCCLFRPSEYLWGTRSGARHVLKAAQLEFECRDLQGHNTTFLSLTAIHGVPWSRVVLLRINMLSAKNIPWRTGARLWFSATDTTTLNLVRVMYNWAQFSVAVPTAPVFSWASPTDPSKRVYLNYRDFHQLIRRTAGRFGFNPTQFGCQGVRAGGATLLRAAGANDGFICLMGRWRSLPSCLRYQEVTTAAHDQMAILLMTPGLYSNRDLRLQYCLPSISDRSAHQPTVPGFAPPPPRADNTPHTGAPTLSPPPTHTTEPPTAPTPAPAPTSTRQVSAHAAALINVVANANYGGTGPREGADSGFDAQCSAFDRIYRDVVYGEDYDEDEEED
jgi:hypothetical protein